MQISYGYFEKDELQTDNFNFFLKAGMVKPPTGQGMHWVIVSSTAKCTPCDRLLEGFFFHKK